METKKLSNEFIQHSAESAAWADISSDYPLTEGILEKYADKLDWSMVSQNEDITWTIPMIDKFKKRLNWKLFSSHIDEALLTPSVIETFKDYWDWDNLSGRTLSQEMLFTYADRWNWNRVINRYNIGVDFDGKGISFYEKYKDYIPEARLQDSYLWSEIVKQAKKQIINDIVTKA